MVFHAGAPDGSPSVRVSAGRRPARIRSVAGFGASPAKSMPPAKGRLPKITGESVADIPGRAGELR